MLYRIIAGITIKTLLNASEMLKPETKDTKYGKTKKSIGNIMSVLVRTAHTVANVADFALKYGLF